MSQQAASSRAPGQESVAPPAATVHPPRGRARARHLWESAARAVGARWDVLAVIAGGGALGSLARWGLAVALPHQPGAFPWATFAANVSGCLLIGALMVFISDVWPPSKYLRPFLGVGVLGGYTTFSTYMLDTRAMLVTGHAAAAGAYLAGSLAAGLAAVWAGAVVVKLAIRARRRRGLRSGGTVGHDAALRPATPHDAGAEPSSPAAGPSAGSSTGEPS